MQAGGHLAGLQPRKMIRPCPCPVFFSSGQDRMGGCHGNSHTPGVPNSNASPDHLVEEANGSKAQSFIGCQQGGIHRCHYEAIKGKPWILTQDPESVTAGGMPFALSMMWHCTEKALYGTGNDGEAMGPR